MYDVNALRTDITNGAVLTPGDEGYDASLKRWSSAYETQAVSSILAQVYRS